MIYVASSSDNDDDERKSGKPPPLHLWLHDIYPCVEWILGRKGDERSGRMPDENYAREILQLFSIGLIELNMDGAKTKNRY